MRKLLGVVLTLVLATVAVAWLTGTKPQIEVDPALKAIGAATPVRIRVSDANGIRSFQAKIEQKGRTFGALEHKRIAPRWKFWRPREPVRVFEFVAGRKVFPGLEDGAARLVLEAKSDDWRGATTVTAVDLSVRSVPPALSADGAQHYINQGGSELVVITAGAEATDAGTRVGPYQFRSWRLPGGAAGARFSLFAYPYDVPGTTAPVVFARDDAGNEATASFWFRVFPKNFRSRDFELTDAFLEKVTREIKPHAPEMVFPGDLMGDFLMINSDLRRLSNLRIAHLRLKTEERFLWSKPFRQLADSKVEAQFADHRRYFYKGAKVDEQDHLGFDLAVTASVPVPAANDGKVVYADYLGIYGNCIVIDHGYGLQSIYGHLSTLAVKPGEMVRQSQELGRSGSTGLAGGDHLHFSMQIDGVQVNPTEWWDEHWIHDRVLLKFPGQKLPASATTRGGAAAGDRPTAALADGRLRRRGDYARVARRGLAD